MSKACIDRSDSWIFQHKRRPPVTKYKKYILGSHTCPLKFIFAPLKAKHFIGKLWQLMTTSNVGAWTQAWQAKWAVFKIPGFVYKRFLPFFPTPSPLFYLYHFSRGLWLSFLVLCSLRSKRFRAFPPTFIFWLLFHFSRGQNRESRSSAFLYSETKRKRLLRRLPYMLPDYCHLWLRLTGRFIFHTEWRQIEDAKSFHVLYA